MQSIIQERGSVAFPKFTGERVYMCEFRKADGLPFDLARWQPTVDAMLDGIDTDQPLYLMIDQGQIISGNSHRRPGVHIDGYWIPAIQAHGGGRHVGQWDNGRWKNAGFVEKEGILLASSISAAKAYSGEFIGQPGEGGDCSHVDLKGLNAVQMQAGRVYAGNVTMLHESLPLESDAMRTLVRINVPGWHPH